jgi:hypothetical protein
MSDKPYVSHSQINLYSNCGEAFRRRYIEGDIIPPGVAALRGRAVHGAAEVNHRQKKKSGIDLSLADLTDAAASTFEETRKREGYSLTPEEQKVGGPIVLGQAKDRAVKLTGLYASHVAPAIEPDLVEERVRIILPAAPVDLLGVLDVTTKQERIKDLKTANRSKAQGEADSSLQLSLYSLAYRVKKGTDPAGIDLEVLVDTTIPKHQRITTTRSRRDYEALVARVNAFLKAKDAGVFPPANVGHWLCSPRWCGYFATCPYVNSERIDAAESAARKES